MPRADRSEHIYHRLESPTQTPQDAALQQSSGEIWGRPSIWSTIPKVKAYRGPLPSNARGIEFFTAVEPDAGSSPRHPEWSGPRPGVRIRGEFAVIRVIVTKNTQT